MQAWLSLRAEAQRAEAQLKAALAGEVVVCGVYLSAYCSPSVDLVGLSILGLDEQRLVESIMALLSDLEDSWAAMASDLRHAQVRGLGARRLGVAAAAAAWTTSTCPGALSPAQEACMTHLNAHLPT